MNHGVDLDNCLLLSPSVLLLDIPILFIDDGRSMTGDLLPLLSNIVS